jgi:hypothetical protein
VALQVASDSTNSIRASLLIGSWQQSRSRWCYGGQRVFFALRATAFIPCRGHGGVAAGHLWQ